MNASGARVAPAVRDRVAEAARLLRSGGVVAFPTETVYGLGANALDPRAVARIFGIKGRPADNPLIVHVASPDAVGDVAREFPPLARRLAEAFWPGPLTVVLPRRPEVPDVTTGGLDSVAVRVPDHAVALALLAEARVPVAAPSANRSGSPSPTRAGDVAADLGSAVDLILDGGPTRVGVESTVVSLLGPVPVVLRAGGIGVEDLEAVAGPVTVHPGARGAVLAGPAPSPGMRHRHYAPEAVVHLVEGDPPAVWRRVEGVAAALRGRGARVAIVASAESGLSGRDVTVPGSRDDPAAWARGIFALLRDFDRAGYDAVVVEGIPERGLGLAVMDRLRRAAARDVA